MRSVNEKLTTVAHAYRVAGHSMTMAKAPGTGGQPCYPNHTCEATLTCLSNVCVQLGSDAGPDAPDDAPSEAAPEAGCGFLTCPVVLASGLQNPASLALDANNVYWTNDVTSGSVMKVARSGGNAITLANQDSPISLATDGSNVYWLDYSAQPSGSANQLTVDGQNRVALATGLQKAVGLAIDSGYVYFIASGAI